MSNGQEVTHVCGARGFGLEPSDTCRACEDARRIRLASSLPAVPANLGFLITMLKEKAISLFVARDRRAESEKEEAEYLKARSHLENLFLEQQREIERLRPSVATETAEPPYPEEGKSLRDPATWYCECGHRMWDHARGCKKCECKTFHVSNPGQSNSGDFPASPDQDFLKLLDDLISKAIFRGRDGSSTQGRLINGSYESRQKAVDAARQSVVDYVELIRRDETEAEAFGFQCGYAVAKEDARAELSALRAQMEGR